MLWVGAEFTDRKKEVQRHTESKRLWLEGPHEPAKWSIEELKAIKQKFTAMARELTKERELAT